MCCRRARIVATIVSLCLALGAGAAEQSHGKPHTEPAIGGIPLPVAQVVNAVRPLLDKEHAKDALAKLDAYHGPTHPLVQRMRADALFLSGDYSAAIDLYRGLLQAPDAPPGTEVNLARALAAAGDKRGAADELSKALAGGLDPHASAADLSLLAACLLEAGEPFRALTLTQTATLRFPEDKTLLRTQIAAMQACERWTDLATLATAVIARTPDDELGWMALVAAREHGSDHDELAAATIAAAQHHAIPLDRVAVDLDRSGLRSAALTYYSQAVKAPGAGWPLISAAANAALSVDRADLAIGFLSHLAGDDAKRPEARRLGAMAAVKAGDQDAARSQLRSLIDDGHASGDVYLWAGKLAEDAGDLAQAADFYERASTFKDSARSAHLAAAVVLAKLHQYDGAHAQAQAALDSDPHDHYAEQIAAWIGQQAQAHSVRGQNAGAAPATEAQPSGK